jgi:N-acetylglucosaminyldiphosphoundecaprenol N-acetyl-beta-D-mannosaminyltransferase
VAVITLRTEPWGERARVELLGTPIDRVERHTLAARLHAFLVSGQPHQIVTANLDFLAIARRRDGFRHLLANVDLVVCDGKPLQWAAALRGDALPARVTGSDILVETCQLSAAHGYRLFLLGAAPGVADRAARALERLYPGVVIAGTYAPPVGAFDTAEDDAIVARVREARADALFVALGAPRQDEWIRDHLGALDVPLCVGVGGIFNFFAGETRRAPAWMQRCGMEWAFRLAQEPGRLWRRYLRDDLPVFLALIAEQAGRRLGVVVPRDAARVETPWASGADGGAGDGGAEVGDADAGDMDDREVEMAASGHERG